MIDFIFLVLPFFLLILTVLLNQVLKSNLKSYWCSILMILATQIFSTVIIVAKSNQNSAKIMSPEALNNIEVPKNIFETSDMFLGVFLVNDNLIYIYALCYLLLLASVFLLVIYRR